MINKTPRFKWMGDDPDGGASPNAKSGNSQLDFAAV